jgi:hypothetical protein
LASSSAGDKRPFTPGLAFKFECTAKIAEGAEMNHFRARIETSHPIPDSGGMPHEWRSGRMVFGQFVYVLQGPAHPIRRRRSDNRSVPWLSEAD